MVTLAMQFTFRVLVLMALLVKCKIDDLHSWVRFQDLQAAFLFARDVPIQFVTGFLTGCSGITGDYMLVLV